MLKRVKKEPGLLPMSKIKTEPLDNDNVKVPRKRKSPAKKIVKSEQLESDDSDYDCNLSKKRKTNNGRDKKKTIKVEPASSKYDDNIVSSIKKENRLAESENLKSHIASNIVRLFQEDNTIPFIARYRQHLTEGMDAERLRHIKQAYDNIELVLVKAENLIKTLKKEGVDDPTLTARVTEARSVDELELIAAPYKKGSKTTLVARAREANLEEHGLNVLHGTLHVNPAALVDPSTPGREDISKVRLGIQHIVADAIAKHADLLEFIEELKKRELIMLEVSARKGVEHQSKNKYDLYTNFCHDVRDVKDHQILAINRGEDQKILSVKVNVPESLWKKVGDCCENQWLQKGVHNPERTAIFNEAVKDAIKRLLLPLLTRKIRHGLTEAAERASIDTFASNLRRLLLSPPVRGRTVLAIDPGAAMGCKVGIVSPQGVPLHTGKIYLTDTRRKFNSIDNSSRARNDIIEWVLKFHCDIIAIGNGCQCRETECFISNLIQEGSFRPLDISYVIVDENGVSIYSCSPEAKKEFPDLDPTLVSAISLARRLQDPLAELVKVEPKHLGVGMYQHDVPEKKLTSALDDVVSECVSFVGVDINTASVHLLRKVAGLTQTRAGAIINRRESEGSFTNRDQILKVKGIGGKTFQQCAGFLRIIPVTAGNQGKLNPLDQTEIHPEDYPLALKVLIDLGLSVKDVGSQLFITNIAQYTRKDGAKPPALAEKFGVSLLQIEQLLGALQKKTDYDLRALSQAPLFRREITTAESLKPGDILTGVVRNVVAFGAFVDVGVGRDGLIHSSQLRRVQLGLGDRVQVQVNAVDLDRGRIQLKFINSLNS